MAGSPIPESDQPRLPDEYSESSDVTSSSLLEAARRNDADGWTDLLNRYERLVWHWCRRAGLRTDDADDVLQIVMSQVAFSLSRFQKDGRRAAFRRWLRTITERKIVDYRRQNSSQPQPTGGTENVIRLMQVMAADDQSQSGAQATDAVKDRVWGLLERVERDVGSNTWDAFWLMTVEGQTSVEAAALLGMTPNAVRLACGRVRKCLRQEQLFDSEKMDFGTEAERSLEGENG